MSLISFSRLIKRNNANTARTTHHVMNIKKVKY